jgi:hypothetical protein
MARWEKENDLDAVKIEYVTRIIHNIGVKYTGGKNS